MGVKTLYICDIGRGKCITHDGYIQLGIMSHNVEKHIELNPTINWIVVHWIPDIFANRYKRVTFQKTEKANEGSPKTDNHS
jgi:methionine aminopeptidase